MHLLVGVSPYALMSEERIYLIAVCANMVLSFSAQERAKKWFFSVCSQEIYGHIRMIGYSEMFDPKKSFLSYAFMALRKWTKFYFLKILL